MRLDANGNRLWTKRYNLDGGEGYGQSIALDDDDNVYYTSPNYNGNRNTEWTTKLDIQDGTEIWQQEMVNDQREDLESSWSNGFTGPKIVADNEYYHYAGFTFDVDGSEGNALAVTLPADGSANNTQAGFFYTNETFYNNEGGGDNPVERTHVVADWTGLQLITGRDPIKAINEFSPVYNYPVYTKGDAGIKFADGTVQHSSAAGLPQVRHRTYDHTFELKLSDAGKHIYFRNSGDKLILPSYSRVPFEVGTVITVVHNSNNDLYIGMHPDTGWYNGYFKVPSIDGSEGSSGSFACGVQCWDNGGGQVITMLKVAQNYRDGSVWMITVVGGTVDTWRDY